MGAPTPLPGSWRGKDLCDAARHMREHHDSSHPRHEFWSAVAAFLEDEAQASEPWLIRIDAVSIARSYLASIEATP